MIWVRKLVFSFLILCLLAGILAFIERVPYLYISLTICFILLFSAIRSRNSSTWKATLINLAAIFLALGLAEVYLAGWQGLGFAAKLERQDHLLEEGGSTPDIDNWINNDEVRGYAPAKNARVSSIATLGHEKIYDVIYTTDQYGLRVSPHDLDKSPASANNSENMVFFGCSCTFGEGVQDNETWPYLVEEKSGGKYKSYNFAMEGYGPHQMLRMLETGFIDTVHFDKKPKVAIYLALPQHIIRSACRYPSFIWGVEGPRYALNLSGELEYTGKFNDGTIPKIKFLIFKQLAKSHLIANSFWIKQLLGWNVTQRDEGTFIKIVARAQKLFTQRYGGRFYVLLWANDIWADESDEYKYIVSELKKYHIDLIETKDIFDQYDSPQDKVPLSIIHALSDKSAVISRDQLEAALAVWKDNYLIKYDRHPNKLAHERIAEYILKYLDSDLSK
jgi:hypothetical protein